MTSSKLKGSDMNENPLDDVAVTSQVETSHASDLAAMTMLRSTFSTRQRASSFFFPSISRGPSEAGEMVPGFQAGYSDFTTDCYIATPIVLSEET